MDSEGALPTTRDGVAISALAPGLAGLMGVAELAAALAGEGFAVFSTNGTPSSGPAART
mgnify:CR=1 FL=1